MKRFLCVLLVLLNVIGFSACTETKEESDVEYANVEYTEEDLIEQFVVEALYDEIDGKFPNADAGSCRYDINKIEEKGEYIYVYGTVWLYDKYGNLTGGYNDGSGSMHRSYEVIIHQNGYIEDCYISY